MLTSIAITLGAVVRLISRLGNFGTGTVWSGKLGLALKPSLIRTLSAQLDERIVVLGTNGKTTTTAMIAHVLEHTGVRVVHNATGANLRNGIAGALIAQASKAGRVHASVGLFEVDEAEFAQIVDEIDPTIVVMLNLFRDQLDRYGEIDVIADKWRKVLGKNSHKPKLVINGDDPLVASIGMDYEGKVVYFGVGDRKIKNKQKDTLLLDSTADSSYCQDCGNKLGFAHISYSHFGSWYCEACGRVRPKLTLDKVINPLQGLYNYYNALAAVLTCIQTGTSKKDAQKALVSFKAVFGRQEKLTIGEKTVQMVLSKNPAGFNESMRMVLEQSQNPTVILALNDRFLDGTDVSWIWDTHLEQLVKKARHIVCTGDRAWDMGLRVKYSSQLIPSSKRKTVTIEPDLQKAIDVGLENTKNNETLYILPTYSAMLDMRKILTGKKI